MGSRTPDAPGPESAEDRPQARRPLLQRPWFAWTIALVLLLASIGAMAWLRSERDDLREEAAMAREQLDRARSDVGLRERALQDEEEEAASLTEALDACVATIRAQRALLSAWIDHVTAVRDGDLDRADATYDLIDAPLEDSNTKYDRCHARAVREGV